MTVASIFSSGQFAEFDKANGCGLSSDGKRHYCIPRILRSTPSWLFHNNGDGTFTDVSKKSGIAASLGKAWGVVATDVNNDDGSICRCQRYGREFSFPESRRWQVRRSRPAR